MTNHLHLLITTETDDGVARLMKRLAQSYVQSVNCTYRRTGTLFKGRYRSSLIEADRSLLACQRYLELNPVRARMVESPATIPGRAMRPMPSVKPTLS